jgi:hypothetical protein
VRVVEVLDSSFGATVAGGGFLTSLGFVPAVSMIHLRVCGGLMTLSHRNLPVERFHIIIVTATTAGCC